MTIGERCRGLRILVTPVRRGEGQLTTRPSHSHSTVTSTAVDPQLPFASIDSDALAHSGCWPMACGRLGREKPHNDAVSGDEMATLAVERRERR